MASGGARSRSGPPPDPNALRRDRKDDGEWLTLPAGGRDGETPEWPLTVYAGKGETADRVEREREIWAEMWRKPQAVAWERFGQHYEVGLMVRRMVEAEQWGSHTSTGTLVRQMMDSLGLTSPGLRSNRWKLSDDEVAEQRDDRRGGGSRARMRVVKADVDGAA